MALNGWKEIIKREIEKLKISIAVLSAYGILTIIFTYPLTFSKNIVPGNGDVFHYLWVLWWFKKSLLSSTSPYFTSYIFYPNGVSLAFDEVTPFNSILSVPMQLAFGLVTTYDLLFILTFILSGYGMFLLVRYLTGDVKAAFVSGLIFMFCPYRFAHGLGHLNLLTTQWLPFYVLFLIKIIKENKIVNSIYAAIFLLFSTLSSYYYLIFLTVFTILYILYYQITDGVLLNKDKFKWISIMLILFSILAIPFLYPLIKDLVNAKSSYMYYGGFIDYSADLLGFFIPTYFHPLFGNIVYPIYSKFTSYEAEYIVSAGYTPLILSIVSYIKIKNKEIKFWTLAAVSFFVLSLGPVLHVGGVLKFPYGGYNLEIPLPYEILERIPIFSLARAPSRWDIMLMLAVAILSGYGVKYISSSKIDILYNLNRKNILFGLISFLILFEFLSVPYPIAETSVSPFYEQIAKEPGDYALLEIPDSFFATTYAEYMYYQTIHGKKLFNGYVSRTPDSVTEFIDSTPYINQFMHVYGQSLHDDISNQNLSAIGEAILNYYDIKYVILHEELMTDEQFRFVNTLLQKSLKQVPATYEHNTNRTWKGQPYVVRDTMVVYKIDKNNGNNLNVKPSNKGWYSLEDMDGVPTRWMRDDATLLLGSYEKVPSKLSFRAQSFNRPRTLNIYVDNYSEANVSIFTNWTAFNVPIKLEKSAKILRFHASDGCERPHDISGLNNSDPRCLSLAFQNISIT